MIKTTVYLPQTTKRQLAALAAREGRPEAELIREAIDRLIHAAPRKPRFPLFKSDDPTMARRTDELLKGFGEH
jgi:ribbon-helix-helix CopG family protein